MFNVLCLQAVGFLFGITNGLVTVTLPKAAFLANASSEELGYIGAGSPLGYGGSCLLFGILFAKQTGKRVLIYGLILSIGVQLWLASSNQVNQLCVGMLLFGITAGSIWPFLSAWMFDFASPKLPRTFILRLYNVAWTGGVVVGCFVGGILLTHYCVPKEVYWIAAGLQFLTLLLVFIPPATHHSLIPAAVSETTPTRHRLAKSLLIAAVIANLTSLGLRLLVYVNYAELNEYLGFDSDRRGYLIACMMGGQTLGFLFGFIYEPWLGLRRLYATYAGMIVGICLTLALCQNLWILMAAALLAGLMGSIAFQCGIFAATECLATPRAGTTFHEAMVGIGGLATIPAGLLVGLMKKDHSEFFALQSPFFAMAGLMLIGLMIQLWLVSRRAQGRLLLPKAVVHNLTAVE